MIVAGAGRADEKSQSAEAIRAIEKFWLTFLEATGAEISDPDYSPTLPTLE